MAYLRNGYWYVSRRDGLKVRTEYLGRGSLVETLAGVHHLEQILDKQQHDVRRVVRHEVDKICNLALERHKVIQGLEKALRLANGFHTHKRQWRKKR